MVGEKWYYMNKKKIINFKSFIHFRTDKMSNLQLYWPLAKTKLENISIKLFHFLEKYKLNPNSAQLSVFLLIHVLAKYKIIYA